MEEKNQSNATEISLGKLLRGKPGELKAYLEEVSFDVSISATKTTTYCHFIALDGNCNVRVQDFVEYIIGKLIDYTIPRSDINKAEEYLVKYNSSSKFLELHRKAKELFTDLINTGEGGELLLYILTNEYLRLPQLLCKMPLKTSKQMHYHGVDGIHVNYDSAADILTLYWGESKMYTTVSSAISNCFESLAPFVLSNGGSGASIDRDLQLVTHNLDLVDEDLQNALLRYFDKDDPNFNKVKYGGICLIGFDFESYPQRPNEKTVLQLKTDIEAKIKNWQELVKRGVLKHESLDTFKIHVFLLPFPSVEIFRELFLKALNKN